ncbi:MAG TPA: cytochrome b N-terminal domain-containing protein [Acidimicrobiales bacterium]|nr:cytochrome b N-terminal domain-containing protein [Acidimicrobiales bacterium]
MTATGTDRAGAVDGGDPVRPGGPPTRAGGEGGWTGSLRARLTAALPPERALPDAQPAYVASWVYLFGVASLASLAVVIASGVAIALGGVRWWHTTVVGHFLNSVHLWSVELFFFWMVLHLWGKFFMAAWRGRRAATWVTGAVSFLVSVACAFTGYLSQTNLDAEWIATQAKDGINSTGAGAFWNVLDLGQMLVWHVMLLPLAVGLLVVAHVVLVRLRGVVPPIGTADDGRPSDDPAAWR